MTRREIDAPVTFVCKAVGKCSCGQHRRRRASILAPSPKPVSMEDRVCRVIEHRPCTLRELRERLKVKDGDGFSHLASTVRELIGRGILGQRVPKGGRKALIFHRHVDVSSTIFCSRMVP